MEEKNWSELAEKERKTRLNLGLAWVIPMLIGTAIVLIGLVVFPTIPLDEDHMTDKSIAVRDLDNATYTWTAKEIKEQRDTQLIMIMVGAAIVFAAYPLLIVMPKETDFHKTYCDLMEDHNVKYCPHCGLKLSRLEKK